MVEAYAPDAEPRQHRRIVRRRERFRFWGVLGHSVVSLLIKSINSLVSRSYEGREDRGLTMTTKSKPTGSCSLWVRKTDRIRRFHQLRIGDEPTLRLTVIPNRAQSRSLAFRNTMKCLLVRRTPLRSTNLNSGRVRSRSVLRSFSSLRKFANSNYFLCVATLRRLRPRARRRLNTFRPPGVCLRERKPCERARFFLLG